MPNSTPSFIFRGYTKKENGHWVSVCIDLNVVSQGATLKEAQSQCKEMVKEYIDYILATYPNEVDRYIPRLAPEEMIDEFNRIFSQVIRQGKKARNKALYYPQFPFGELAASCVQ